MGRRGILCLLWFLAISTPAIAAPITYFFDTGSAHVTANRTSDTSLVADTTIGLDGVFVTFDTALGELIDFSITAPLSAAIPMVQAWGGFDTFVVESASIVPGGTYSSIFSSMIGPTNYSFLAGPVDVAGVYGAFNAGGPPPAPVSGVPVPFAGSSFLNGTIDTDTLVLELLGITLAAIPGASFGESDDLLVKADIMWTGVIPEPSTVVLMGLGLISMASARRKGRLPRA